MIISENLAGGYIHKFSFATMLSFLSTSSTGIEIEQIKHLNLESVNQAYRFIYQIQNQFSI